jgi:hypothetical protein
MEPIYMKKLVLLPFLSVLLTASTLTPNDCQAHVDIQLTAYATSAIQKFTRENTIRKSGDRSQSYVRYISANIPLYDSKRNSVGELSLNCRSDEMPARGKVTATINKSSVGSQFFTGFTLDESSCSNLIACIKDSSDIFSKFSIRYTESEDSQGGTVWIDEYPKDCFKDL